METALSKLTNRHHTLPLTLHHHRPSMSRPISSMSFRIPPPPPPSSSSSYSSSTSLNSSSLSSPIKASSSTNFSNRHLPDPKNPKHQLIQTPNPYPFALLRITLIAAVTATALFLARFNLKPLIAAPTSPPPTIEESISDEEREKSLEKFLNSHPDDVQALRSLMELKIKNKKIQEAVQIIEQLIKLEPDDSEWPLLKSHMYFYSGDTELAKIGFNEILSKDPLRVEAYHGLVMAASQGDSTSELKDVEKRVAGGIEMAKKENNEDLRDFNLLLAQIRVIEGDYNDALKIYQELVQEEPRDFRPYLCQGIIYTLLRKKDEAEKNFQKYRRLVPKGHPYARYFDDNMIATKLFSQKVENDRARAKS